MDYKKAISELNRIAQQELGTSPKRSGPKRHRHDWSSRNQLKRGTTVTFYCEREGCGKTKQVYFPELPKS